MRTHAPYQFEKKPPDMTYSKFIETALVPQATASLQSFYQKYCDGVDIRVEAKSDKTPASIADRETEKILRDLIMNEYPDHGIWGEEFGAYQIDKDIIWVLDPLDGTREFLSKYPDGFGNLIGVLDKGRAVEGVITDPTRSVIYSSEMISKSEGNVKPLRDSVVACTNVEHMFEADFAEALKGGANKVVPKLNCMGVVHVVDGRADAFVEDDLCLHDIAPMLPVMMKAGLTVIDFDGNDYAETIFDVTKASHERYGVIAAASPDLANEILDLYRSVS